MLRRRHLLLLFLAALVIALIAWLALAGKSNAPETAPGGEDSPTAAPLAAGRIFFSAGGSIYAVSPDGSGLTLIIEGERGDRADHDKQRAWASSPSVSPDGRALAFVRDYDVWASDVDGSNQRRLIEAGDWVLDPCCASNGSLGASSVAWSPDGRRLLYVVSRIAGSGITQLWLANADGSRQVMLDGTLPNFLVASWIDRDTALLYPSRDDFVGPTWRLVGYNLAQQRIVAVPVKTSTTYATASVLKNGGLLAGPFFEEGMIEIGASGSLTQLASGTAPSASPDGGWVAYLRGNEVRLVDHRGQGERLVLDLTPLGGRDRHFANNGCYPPPPAQHPPACSFRPPVLSWGP